MLVSQSAENSIINVLNICGGVLGHTEGILGSDIPNKYWQSTMNAL